VRLSGLPTLGSVLARALAMGVVLALVAAFAMPPRGAAALPNRVRELCGEEPISFDTLCNVDEDLREAFLLVERIVGAEGLPTLSRIAGVVRDGAVSIDWYPNPERSALRRGLIGLYADRDRRVYVPWLLHEEPLRVRASVMAHELDHAAWDVDQRGVGMTPDQSCLDGEIRAYKTGILVYEYTRRVFDEPKAPAGEVDTYLDGELVTWRMLSGGQTLADNGLNDLANRHIFSHGYDSRCNWRS
jgi:hypothetical protein